MRQTVTRIRGLTVNITVEEVHHTDAHGGLLCYIASIYIQKHGSSEKKLVRKSRLPGTAAELEREIRRDGIRAFDQFTAR